jgi:hypothetical protein
MKEQEGLKGVEPPPPERRNGPEDRRNPSHLENILVKALMAMVVVGLSCAAAIFGFGFVLKEIQQQRFDSLVQTCEETNRRNVKVNAEIDSAVDALPANRQTDEQKAGTDAFRLIISAAVPFTDDCHAYAKERVRGYF